MKGPVAPKDPVKKRPSLYIMRNKEVAGLNVQEGLGIQYIYLNDGRMVSSAEIVGNLKDQEVLELLKTTKGFRKLVHSIGVTLEADDSHIEVEFVFQMYGKSDVYGSGTILKTKVLTDGMEQIVSLQDCCWSEEDDIPGQIRFVFPRPMEQANATVRLYLNDGYIAPQVEEESDVDFESPFYQEMLDKAIFSKGNNRRLKKALEKAKKGEEVTIGFIGGSITQGAGAVPIHTQSYAYRTFEGLCKLAGCGTKEHIHLIKAGVGGTPSELGMIRYEEDVLRNGKVEPDIVVVEFAVNDEGDETKGVCYDSLVRKIYSHPSEPAVLLLFAVFANDWNLQERLSPVGFAYQLPMISTKDTVVEQFYKKQGEGKVVSKNQFFYDPLHPSNIGHRIMADGILRLMEEADRSPMDEEIIDIEAIHPPLGGEFQHIKRLDRKRNKAAAQICCGSFEEYDDELQGVEMDQDVEPTKEFPDNWIHRNGAESFTMDITCKALILVFKDSGSPNVGCAEVHVDGKQVLLANPRQNGWTHCNPMIIIRDSITGKHHVEIKMQDADAQKEFTILGFGYVE